MTGLVFLALTFFAAPQARVVEFEVASVRAAPPPEAGKRMFTRITGGPGTKDPTRAVWDNAPLDLLVMQAYDMPTYQYRGPAWMGEARFNVSANVPEDATKEQFRAMLQNLLVKRFGLVVHREQKEMQVYELSIAASGHKLKESSDAAPDVDTSGPPPPPSADAAGYPVFPVGRGSSMGIMNGHARLAAERETMETFAHRVSQFLAAPVVDATSLKGKYDFTVSWSFDMAPMVAAGHGPPPPPPPPGGEVLPPPPLPERVPGPTLVQAIAQQLGIKVTQKKSSVEILVVDRADKTPLEN